MQTNVTTAEELGSSLRKRGRSDGGHPAEQLGSDPSLRTRMPIEFRLFDLDKLGFAAELQFPKGDLAVDENVLLPLGCRRASACSRRFR